MAFNGYVLLLVSVLCNAARYHMDKKAIALGAQPAMLVGLSGLVAAAGFLLCGMVWRALGWRAARLDEASIGGILATLRSGGRVILAAAVLGAAGSYLNTYCVKGYGPELTAFLANMAVIFVVFGGLLGGERFTRGEAVTVAAIVAGAFLFSYKGGGTPGGGGDASGGGGRFQFVALGLMTLSCLFTASKQLSVKRAATGQSLVCVMVAVLAAMGLTSLIVAALAAGPVGAIAGLPAWMREEWSALPAPAVVWMVAGSVVGSMMGMTLLYAGFLRVGVSRGAPIDALRPLAVLLIGVALVRLRLAPRSIDLGVPQLIGGAMVLAGSAVLARLSRRGAEGPKASSANQRDAAPPAPDI